MSDAKKPDREQDRLGSPAYDVANKLSGEYGLSYRCKVNLEGTANALIILGMTEDEAFALLNDVVDNIEFLDER